MSVSQGMPENEAALLFLVVMAAILSTIHGFNTNTKV